MGAWGGDWWYDFDSELWPTFLQRMGIILTVFLIINIQDSVSVYGLVECIL
jgi:hypothetical protein